MVKLYYNESSNESEITLEGTNGVIFAEIMTLTIAGFNELTKNASESIREDAKTTFINGLKEFL